MCTAFTLVQLNIKNRSINKRVYECLSIGNVTSLQLYSHTTHEVLTVHYTDESFSTMKSLSQIWFHQTYSNRSVCKSWWSVVTRPLIKMMPLAFSLRSEGYSCYQGTDSVCNNPSPLAQQEGSKTKLIFNYQTHPLHNSCSRAHNMLDFFTTQPSKIISPAWANHFILVDGRWWEPNEPLYSNGCNQVQINNTAADISYLTRINDTVQGQCN